VSRTWRSLPDALSFRRGAHPPPPEAAGDDAGGFLKRGPTNPPPASRYLEQLFLEGPIHPAGPSTLQAPSTLGCECKALRCSNTPGSSRAVPSTRWPIQPRGNVARFYVDKLDGGRAATGSIVPPLRRDWIYSIVLRDATIRSQESVSTRTNLIKVVKDTFSGGRTHPMHAAFRE